MTTVDAERGKPGPGSGDRHLPVAIVGSGFAGLGTAIRLRQAGIEFAVFEKADRLGGTWRDNSYPGSRCDVPSHLYSFSFAPNPGWTHTYPTQGELWEYLEETARRFEVADAIRFGQEVEQARWDGEAGHWEIDTTAGRFTAGSLVLGNGPLSAPSVPDVEGLEDFEGTVFHSAAWDHDHDLAGERVAVIGTGASAIQFIPEIQPQVDELVVFQRTPGWVLPHPDRAIHPWERRLYRAFPPAQRAVRWTIYWARELTAIPFVKRPRMMRHVQRIASGHLRRQVADPTLRTKLTPDYSPGCKRLLLSDDYYPALASPNVEVVTDRIAGVTRTGIRTADGRERPVDTIILGTGFKVVDNPAFDIVVGPEGRTLGQAFQDKGMAAYLGTTVPGFPNLFVIGGPNTGIGHTSLVFMYEAQIHYLVAALRTLEERGATSLEVRREPFDAYNADLQRRMRHTVWSTGGCRSWYLDAHGNNPTLWPDWTWRFFLRTRTVRPEDYRFEPARTGPA